MESRKPEKKTKVSKEEKVSLVLSQYPEMMKLAQEYPNLGTPEELYTNYLNTIFPKSMVQEVVYHSGKKADLESLNTISNWTPQSTERMEVEQRVSKGLYTSINKDYLEKIAVYNSPEMVYSLKVNVSKPLKKEGVLNSNDIEISAVEKDKKELGIDSYISNEGGKGNTIIVLEPEQIHVIGSEKDKKSFSEFLDGLLSQL